MCHVRVTFNPTLLGCLPSNENSVSKLRSSSYVCLFAVINLHSHHKNHINWIKRFMKLLFKNALIPPRPQVSTCYHKDSLPLHFVCFHLLAVEIVKDPIPPIQRKEIGNLLMVNLIFIKIKFIKFFESNYIVKL